MSCLICPTHARFLQVSGDFGPQCEADDLKQSDDEMMTHGFLTKLSCDFVGSSNVNLRILSYFFVMVVCVPKLSWLPLFTCHVVLSYAVTFALAMRMLIEADCNLSDTTTYQERSVLSLLLSFSSAPPPTLS